jgi:hypothetical protein
MAAWACRRQDSHRRHHPLRQCHFQAATRSPTRCLTRMRPFFQGRSLWAQASLCRPECHALTLTLAWRAACRAWSFRHVADLPRCLLSAQPLNAAPGARKSTAVWRGLSMRSTCRRSLSAGCFTRQVGALLKRCTLVLSALVLLGVVASRRGLGGGAQHACTQVVHSALSAEPHALSMQS